MTPEFINVDLEVVAQTSLNQIRDALSAGNAFELHYGPTDDGNILVVELGDEPEPTNPDQAIARFCDLIEGFDSAAASAWGEARRKCFDIGIRGALSGEALRSVISSRTIRRVADLGVSLVITTYPLQPSPTGSSTPNAPNKSE